MTVTLELPAEALQQLRAEAGRRDLSVDALIAEFAGTLGVMSTDLVDSSVPVMG